MPSLGLFTGGTKLTYVAAAGATNNVNFGGAWPAATVGRVDVNSTAGVCNFTGAVAATVDGQGVLIRNLLGGNNLTLNSLNTGSTAANRFSFENDLLLPPGAAVMLVYDLATALWEVAFIQYAGNVTPDVHPALPTGVGLGPNDEFESGTSIDTTGARYTGATAWTAFGVAPTDSVANGALLITSLTTGSDRFNGWTQPTPAAPWTYTTKLKAQVNANSNASLVGMFVATATGGAGKNVALALSGTYIIVQENTSNTVAGSNPVIQNALTAFVAPDAPINSEVQEIYLQITYDGTNLDFAISIAGHTGGFQQIYTNTAATLLGAAPALIGLGVNVYTSPQTSIFDWFRRTA